MALAIIRNDSAIRLSNKNISQTHKNKKNIVYVQKIRVFICEKGLKRVIFYRAIYSFFFSIQV